MPKAEKLHDQLRGKRLTSTPEEKVRQTLLHHLIHDLRFPKELIAVEKRIDELPHLLGASYPNRRIDLLCYSKKQDTLHPLLLIECKALELSEKAFEQLLGYNHHVGASFMAVATLRGVRFLASGRIGPILSYIPSYETLLLALST